MNGGAERGSYRSGVDLAEAGVNLVRQAGLAAYFLYLCGVLPFALAMTYYWASMLNSSEAERHIAEGALGLAVLFVWMRAIQARYAQHLRRALADVEPPPWGVGPFLRTCCRQAAIHATSLVVYPIGFVTLIPMGYAIAAYQNAQILDRGDGTPLRSLARDAIRLGLLWPKQNHAVIWICSPLLAILTCGSYLVGLPILKGIAAGYDSTPFILSVGVAYLSVLMIALVVFAPAALTLLIGFSASIGLALELAHVLTGADTLFNRNPVVILENEAMIALICTLVYLVLDPVLKAAYVIRAHEGESLLTGADLRVALARIRRAASASVVLALVAASLALPGLALAQEAPTVPRDAETLNSAIDEELDLSRYTWRSPRRSNRDGEANFLSQAIMDFAESMRDRIERALSWAQEQFRRLMDWLFNRNSGAAPGSGILGGGTVTLRIATALVVAALLALTLYVIWTAFRNRQRLVLAPLAPLDPVAPDLESETTTAADLPEDEWYRLARELAARGDFRLAARALFFSSLSALARREVIRIARFKSNLDYQRELERRATSVGSAPVTFRRMAFIYESVWYGEHPAGPDTLNQLNGLYEELGNAIQ